MKKHLLVTIVALAASTGMAFAGSDGNKYITVVVVLVGGCECSI